MECETQRHPTFLRQPSPPPTQTSSRWMMSQQICFNIFFAPISGQYIHIDISISGQPQPLPATLVLKPALPPPPWYQLRQSLAQMSTSWKGEIHKYTNTQIHKYIQFYRYTTTTNQSVAQMSTLWKGEILSVHSVDFVTNLG